MTDGFTFFVLGYKARLLHPEYGLLVLGVLIGALLLGLAAIRDARILRATIPVRLLPKMLPGYSPTRRGLKLSLGLGAALLASLSLLQPQCGSGTELARKVGIDVVVALDVSRSMLARDVKPSRLARARLELTDLIDHLDGDRFGLVVFAGSAFVQCPMTTDYAAAKLFLRAVDAKQMPTQGTDLAAALGAAEKLLSSREGARGKIVVLLTDGEDHSGRAKEVAGRLAKSGARIFAVGIGSPEGEPIPILSRHGDIIGYKKDAAGNTVLSHLDAATLQALAETGKGVYVAAGTAGAGIEQVIAKMDEMEKSEFEARLTTRYTDRSLLFLAPAFFFLVFASLVRPGSRPPRRPKASAGARTASLMTLFLLLALPALGGFRALESEDPAVDAGNRAFAKGDYPTAVKAYDEALARLEAPADRARVQYNKGTALAAAGEMEKARGALQAALAEADDGLKATDLYNLGTGLLKTGDLEGAKAALIRSLQIDSENAAARHNLEIALRGMNPPDAGEKKDEQPKDQKKDDEQQDSSDSSEKESDSQQEKDGAKKQKKEGEGEKQQKDADEGEQQDDTAQGSNDEQQDAKDDPASSGEQEEQGEGTQDPQAGTSGEQQDPQGKPDQQDQEDARKDDAQATGERDEEQEAKGEAADAESMAGEPATPGGDEEKEGARGAIASEEAERILDALSRSEKPMQMQLFRMGEYKDEKPKSGEKDW